jgi:hypothetical protein
MARIIPDGFDEKLSPRRGEDRKEEQLFFALLAVFAVKLIFGIESLV